MVVSDDYGAGSVPEGEFHYIALISCQRSLGACRKYQVGRSFQLMHRSSVWAKCLDGRNKERLKTGVKEVSTDWVAVILLEPHEAILTDWCLTQVETHSNHLENRLTSNGQNSLLWSLSFIFKTKIYQYLIQLLPHILYIHLVL